MTDGIVFHYEKENYGVVRVFKDENPVDTTEDLMLLGKIIGFDSDDYLITPESKKQIRQILSRNDVISMPLFYTPKGIYTQSQLEERLSGCIYISHDEIKEHLGVSEITDDVVDEVIMELFATVEMFEMKITGNVYKYEIYDETGNLVESVGSFYDVDSCITESKRHFLSMLNDDAVVKNR